MIREQKTYQIPSVIQTGGRLGMQTMRQAIETLVVRGLVSREFLPKPGEGDEKGPGEVGAGGPRPSFPPPPGAPPSDFEAWRQKSKPK
jgi:twitching motility protein PilT